MRTFRLEQSDKEITSHAGVGLIGAAKDCWTPIRLYDTRQKDDG